MAAPLTRSALRTTVRQASSRPSFSLAAQSSLGRGANSQSSPNAHSITLTARSNPAPRLALLHRSFATASPSPSSSDAQEQPRLRLGSTAPNFTAQTTAGELDFHAWKRGSWAVLFSHPADFTPVCTTELGAFARFQDAWEAKGVKMIGLSANGLESHGKWVDDIADVTGARPGFPIIADPERRVAWLYDMIDQADVLPPDAASAASTPPPPAMTIRSVFIVDPADRIRLTMQYPASTGRNTAEVDRALGALLTHEARGVNTPVDWVEGGDVIVPPAVSTQAAREKFGDVREVKPYLRWVK